MSYFGLDSSSVAGTIWLELAEDLPTVLANDNGTPLSGDAVVVRYQATGIANPEDMNVATLYPTGGTVPASAVELGSVSAPGNLAGLSQQVAENPSTPAAFDWGTPFP
jgi:hypothetical protein